MSYLESHTFEKFIRFFGWVNILSSVSMTVPPLADASLAQLNQLNTLLGLEGQLYTTPNNPLHSFLIHVAGMSLVWVGILALLAAKNIAQRKDLLFWNAAAKIIFAALVLYYVFAWDIMRIFLGFALMDIGIVVGYVFFLVKEK